MRTISTIGIISGLHSVKYEYNSAGLKATYMMGDKPGELKYTNEELVKALKSNGTIDDYIALMFNWILIDHDKEETTLRVFMAKFDDHIKSFIKWHEFNLQLRAEYELHKVAMEMAIQSLSKVG